MIFKHPRKANSLSINNILGTLKRGLAHKSSLARFGSGAKVCV